MRGWCWCSRPFVPSPASPPATSTARSQLLPVPNATGNKNPAGNEDSSSSGGTEEPSARRKNAVLHATAGAIAGAISRFVVGPLDVLKIRFQVQLEPIASSRGAAAMPSHYTSIHQALVTIVKEEGVRGLWRGTVPGQLLTIPYTAVQVRHMRHWVCLLWPCAACEAAGWQSGVADHPIG